MGRLLQMPDPIRWIPIASTALESASYVAQRRWLYLRFKSGEIYRYFDFPPDKYRDFMAAESKGTYFGKYIREQFRYEHIPRSRHAGG
jgi:hypothetical protein